MGVCAYPTGDPGTGTGTGPGTGDGDGDGDGDGEGTGQDAVEQLFAGAPPQLGYGVSTQSPEAAVIKYLYDVGGESIFAPSVNAAKGGKIEYNDSIRQLQQILKGNV
jgi:hypothetical protein